MKHKIRSAVLALCVCISSQPIAYASQEIPSQQEDILTEESADEPDSHDDENMALLNDVSQQEKDSAEESVNEPDNRGDESTDLSEDDSTQEDDSTEESAQETDNRDNEITNPSEDISSKEKDSAEETADEPDSHDDENSDPSEDASAQEDDSAEEAADKPDDNVDESSAPSEDNSMQEDDSMEEAAKEPDSSNDENTTLSEDSLMQKDEDVLTEELADDPAAYAADDGLIPTPTEVYNAMIALKNQDAYKEETIWTNDTPYSTTTGGYKWNGGPLDGKIITARGCAAFAFILSDEAFGRLPARMYAEGDFTYEDIKVGDILRMNNDSHTVIVLKTSDVGVVIAEGNYSGKVHWGRTIPKEIVERDSSHYITRYPEGYISPDDEEANVSVDKGTLKGGLTWNLTKAGTLTISGKGSMPDFSSAEEQPWKNHNDTIRKVVIEDGVTRIGSCAFWNCEVLSVKISSSVTAIGNSAFRNSSIISMDIPSGVKTIGDNAFRACTSLTSIDLPASIEEVGTGAFMECTEMSSATFAPSSKQVKLGDNIFTRCYELMSVTLPTNADRIGEGMFQNCGMIAEVEIPQGAKSIGGSAFASSGVSIVIIPDSVTEIGIAAFSACPLTDIYFTGTKTQWNNVRKIGDTTAAVSKATIHYNYIPTKPEPNPDDGDNTGDNTDDNPGSNTGDNPGDNTGDNPGDNPGSNTGDNTGDNTGNNPGSSTGNHPGSSTGSNSGSSSDGSSSGRRDTDSNRTQNTSANTATGQWVAENTGTAKGTGWKLEIADGIYVSGTVTTDIHGNLTEQIVWAQVNNVWYAFGADGYADSGWVMDEAAGSWYFIDIDSGMQTGWHNDTNDSETYFMDPVSGKMLTGWNLIEGKWYYFNPFIDIPTWQRDGMFGDWIYTGSDKRPFGAMFKGETTPDGYVVDENGAWIG